MHIIIVKISHIKHVAIKNYFYIHNFFPLWLYTQIFGLGRLHKTFRFNSRTRSGAVGRTPLTGDQLVARPLRVCLGWLWGWRIWWNERFWQGKPRYSEKTCPDATLFTTNPTCQTRARTRAAAVGRQRLTAWAMAWLIHKNVLPLSMWVVYWNSGTIVDCWVKQC
jgi:hypothetical protein